MKHVWFCLMFFIFLKLLKQTTWSVDFLFANIIVANMFVPGCTAIHMSDVTRSAHVVRGVAAGTNMLATNMLATNMWATTMFANRHVGDDDVFLITYLLCPTAYTNHEGMKEWRNEACLILFNIFFCILRLLKQTTWRLFILLFANIIVANMFVPGCTAIHMSDVTRSAHVARGVAAGTNMLATNMLATNMWATTMFAKQTCWRRRCVLITILCPTAYKNHETRLKCVAHFD